MTSSDSMVLAVSLLVVSLMVLTAFFIGNTVINKMTEEPLINSSSITLSTLRGGQSSFTKFDQLTLAFLIGGALAIIITGYFAGGHPIFMGIYILVIVIMLAISPILSNVWETFSTNAAFTTSLTSFPITNHIMLLLPVYMCSIAFMGFIAMFGKSIFKKGGGL